MLLALINTTYVEFRNKLHHVINYKIGHLLQSLSEPLKLNFPPTITNHGLGPIT